MSEPPGEPDPYPPADLRRRALARTADTALALLPLVVLGLRGRPLAAAVGAVGLTLCNDRLFGPGRSLGKRLFGLRCIVLETRAPSGITASMKRNAALALALLPAADGSTRGFWLAAVTFAAVAVSEAVAVLAPLQRLRDLGRRRIGDVAAGTQVIDASIAVGLPVRRPATAASKQVLDAQHRAGRAGSAGAPGLAAAARRKTSDIGGQPSVIGCRTGLAKHISARRGPGVRSPTLGRLQGAPCDSP
jgi:hypothetical protein